MNHESNLFLVTFESGKFTIYRWMSAFLTYGFLKQVDDYRKIPNAISSCYKDGLVPYPLYVSFALEFKNNYFCITKLTADSEYPVYDYQRWTYNERYLFGSKEWNRIMSYDVQIKQLLED